MLYFLFFLRFSSDTNLNIMNNIIYTITNPLRMTWRRNYDRKLISIRFTSFRNMSSSIERSITLSAISLAYTRSQRSRQRTNIHDTIAFKISSYSGESRRNRSDSVPFRFPGSDTSRACAFLRGRNLFTKPNFQALKHTDNLLTLAEA